MFFYIVFFIAANFAAFIMYLLLLSLFTENKTAFHVNHLQGKHMLHVKCHDLYSLKIAGKKNVVCCSCD